MRRRCAVCDKLTHNWQSVNYGWYHCYDGCYSTTGIDHRTEDGKPLWLQAAKTEKLNGGNDGQRN